MSRKVTCFTLFTATKTAQLLLQYFLQMATFSQLVARILKSWFGKAILVIPWLMVIAITIQVRDV